VSIEQITIDQPGRKAESGNTAHASPLRAAAVARITGYE
jgi:hypothetical protein